MAFEGLMKAGKSLGDFSSAISPFTKGLSTIAGLGIGIGQGVKARRLRGEADKFIPSPEDPEQRDLLNLIKRKARAIETGTDPVSAAGRKIIQKNLATTQGNIVRSSGGDSRKVIEGLSRTSDVAGDSTARLAASVYPASQYYTELGSNLLNKISSRKFDLTMSQRAQKLREAAEMKAASNKNISGAIGFGLPL